MYQEDLQYIVEKSKTKKDGIYKARGSMYRVVDNWPKFIANKGKIYELNGHFLVALGKYHGSIDNAKNMLKEAV